MKYGKAALLMGIALLVPCQFCWANDAFPNSAASNVPQAVQPANTVGASFDSCVGVNAGFSERAGASTANPTPNTPSTGGSEGTGSGSQPSHPTYTKGWNQTDGGWVYLASDAQDSFCEGWLKLGDTWYWLDPTTHLMATGVVECNGCTYRFLGSGAMATGWSYDSEASLWYYSFSSGELAQGWLHDRGAWYWLDPETRAMRTGWLEEGGAEYWLDASGAMASCGWVLTDDGQAFYAGSSGAILCKGVQSADGIIVTGEDGLPFAGWIELDGNRFLFSDEGLMLTGWQELDGTWYYLNDQGIMQTGWLYWDGRWYLLGNFGAMQTGWNYVDGNWYYFNSWGYMACGGWQYIGSVDYKFSSSGAMVGAWVDVPCYMQYPELPTGCESVALTNLLNYYGFGLSKTTIAGHYLPLSWSNNFVTAFAGDPFTGTGGFNGCVAPAIVIAGNNYLSAAGSSLRAVDVSFSSIPALKSRLSCGQPIEVWNTEWGGYPGGRYAASWYNGHSYGLWGGNHAVVLKGYDDEEGIVYVSDSISGDVTRDAKVFFSTWQMMDSQAVAIE